MKFYLRFKEALEKRKLWNLFIYLFFGGLATIVNIVTYFICVEWLSLHYLVANGNSWIASVLFAFVTNKVWVFHSKTESMLELLVEFAKFIFYRVLSLGMDMGVMYVMIDLMNTTNLTAKIVTQIIVVLANYLFSKFLIFNQAEIKNFEVNDES